MDHQFLLAIIDPKMVLSAEQKAYLIFKELTGFSDEDLLIQYGTIVKFILAYSIIVFVKTNFVPSVIDISPAIVGNDSNLLSMVEGRDSRPEQS